MKINVRKIALCGLYSALATLSFALENLFPPIILPGARLGLSNIFILLTVLTVGKWYGFAALTVKILIGSIFSGNLSSAIYSLPAGIISLSVEIALLFFVKKISVVAVSVAGAVINSTVQNVIFCLVTDTAEYLFYLPYLALIAVFAGALVGITVYFTVKRLTIKPQIATRDSKIVK